MNIILQRYSDNRQSTLGILFKSLMIGERQSTNLLCYTIEDEYRDDKVIGQTRIPAGKYEIDFNKADTPLTLKYRAKFPFFTYHLEVKNVTNFKGIYIHIGNSDVDSMGCILLVDSVDNNSVGVGSGGNSTIAFTRIYKLIAEALEGKDKVYIDIRDEKELL